MDVTKSRTAWLGLAIASGACAAFNGVFAKLTTTELTATWAQAVSRVLSLDSSNRPIELLVRGVFFLLNLLFNAIMWGLFTRALTLASSTVRVSIINTSANFMITAMLGALIFSEALPGLWWVGAMMLVAGSVIIGRREEGIKVGNAGTAGAELIMTTEENEQEVDSGDELNGRDGWDMDAWKSVKVDDVLKEPHVR